MSFWKRLHWIGFPPYPYTQWEGRSVGLSFRVNDGRLLFLDPTKRYNRVEWSINGVATTPLESPQEMVTYVQGMSYWDFHLQFVMPSHDVHVEVKVCHGTSGYPTNCNDPDAVIDGWIYALTSASPNPPTDPVGPSGILTGLEAMAPYLALAAAGGLLAAALIWGRRNGP